MRTIRTMIWLRLIPIKISVPKCVAATIFWRKNAQKLHRINQRKGNCFIQASSDDEDVQDDEYDSGFSAWISPIGMPKICVALNKEKGVLHWGIQWRWGRSGRWFHYTLYLSRFPYPSVFTTAERPCWSLCADLRAFSEEIGKVPTAGYFGLKSAIWGKREKDGQP